MKTMKKILTLLLVLVLALSLAVPAFAEDSDSVTSGVNDNTGKITITDPVPNETYTVYQLLTLVSFKEGTTPDAPGNYVYSVSAAWKPFFEGSSFFAISADGYDYVTLTDAGAAMTDAQKAQLAKDALAFAETKGIAAAAGPIAPVVNGDIVEDVVFSGLNLGYYLVDSSAGALCNLTTTHKEQEIIEKNGTPGNEKKIVSDGDASETNEVKIGDTVNFQSTITAKSGAQNYVLHDAMDPGLTWDADSVVVYQGSVAEANKVDPSSYTVSAGDEAADPCTFHVVFDQDFLDTLADDEKVIVAYSAVVNDQATMNEIPNQNKSKLEYGNGTFTEWDDTKTYTWELDIVKFAKEGTNEIPLSGAKFKLYAEDQVTVTDGKAELNADAAPISFTKRDGVEVYYYDADGAVTEITTTGSGTFNLEGLNAGTYYLEETAAPVGYNRLAGLVEVVITVEEQNGEYTGNVTIEADGATVAAGADKVSDVKIENKSGTLLPETGGIGTTIFYVLGGLLVFGAVVLLVTRKRMSTRA